MSFIISLLISALAVVCSAYLLPGISVKNFGQAILVALFIGLANAIIKPIMIFLTFPITVVTLGLFLFVINAIIILLVSALLPNFKVRNFGWALLFSIVLSVVNWILHVIL